MRPRDTDNGLLEIPDTRQDPRTADNPLVGNHVNMKFYAGMPFTDPNGHPLGTLCVLDNEPRTLSAAQRAALVALSGQVEKLIELVLAVEQARQAQRHAENEKITLAAMHQYLMLLNEHVPVMIAQVGADERYVFVNSQYAEFFGRQPDDIIGRSVREVLGETSYRLAHPHLALAFDGHIIQFDLEIDRPDGEHKTLLVRYAPAMSAGDKVRSIVSAVTDVTDRKALENHRALLLNELQHRVKNSLTTISTIARQTARGAPTVDSFLETFNGRLRAIGTAHSILTETKNVGAGLRALITGQVEPYVDIASGRLILHGTDVALSAQCAHALGLVLHELTTNAMKHGALSNQTGKIDLRWRLVDQDGIEFISLVWSEQGGPAVSKPAATGFGSKLIQSMLSHSLSGRVEIDYKQSGLIAQLLVPTTPPTVGIEHLTGPDV